MPNGIDGRDRDTTGESALIDALLSPSAHPRPVSTVELRRTHLSLVFLAGDVAYKVKRSVDLGFVDFRDIDARRRACDDEVRLNRRLAPTVYLGVSPILRMADGSLRFVDDEAAGSGTIIDWAVRMVRIPDERMLDRLLDLGQVDDADLDALADLLAEFLASRPRDEEAASLGTADAVERKFLSHLDRMSAACAADGTALHPAPLLNRLRRWTKRWLETRRTLLQRRVDEGHVREGHGDLHAANIALVDGRWIVMDCVEFRRDFRCLDAAAEAAVLTMDIAHRSDARRARRIGDRIAARTEPDAVPAERDALRRAYGAHYAAVRSHVLALRAVEETDASRRSIALDDARSYLHHAVGLTLDPSLTILCGLPGSGKSVVARAVARALEADLFSSDLIRKELAGIAPTDRRGREPDSTLYGPEMTARVFDTLCRRAAEALAHGIAVVIDATNARREWRDGFARVADATDVPALLLWLDLPDGTIRSRLRARTQEADQPSDADEGVYEAFLRNFEAPTEWPSERLVRVREACSTESIAALVLETLDAPTGNR